MNSKIENLRDIANILRRDSIEATTAAGSGHPTSCLSCAEILSCLFFSEMSYNPKNPEDPGNDEFILSKGHAAPILYSALFRAGCINTDLLDLRDFATHGLHLEGHPMPEAVKWAKVATGSLGQGLSIGLGMSLAAKLTHRNFKTFVLLGDSESAEGSVWEAISLAPHYKLNNLIAIVDINRLGQRGETMLGHKIEDYKTRFSAFGWNVIIVDGHSIPEILRALRIAKKSSGKPTAILAKTFKGSGISFLENKEGWHGKALSEKDQIRALSELSNPEMPEISPRIPKPSKVTFKKSKLKNTEYKENTATREAYGSALANLAKSDSSIIAIDAEVSNSTKSDKVKSVAPKQFVETFIAEQNLAGIALGLSKKGFNSFASTFAAFLSRAHDQIRMAALSSPEKLTFCGSHSGVSIGTDGPSQMGLEDIAMFRSLPSSIVIYPSDAVSTEKLTYLCSKTPGLKYIRTTRAKTPVLYKQSESFKLGDFKVLRQSKKDRAVLIGSGITLHDSLKAHEALKPKISTAVIDLYSIRPLNSRKLSKFIKKHGSRVVITEDHYEAGGIGEAVLSALKNTNIKINHLCVRKQPHSGKPEELLKHEKIDSEAIIKAI